ncbi:MAG: DDE-type integrase/transposase/recombinase [Gammaproteobacteria bacterium]|nr:DDE-type integrase/transposase/recombinase [Gammaproteobacteria bacterium]MYA65971.1 DDE-type integrase/transposase/recombinase [Gammaproteobacteria bacterium]MYG95912.1 DDE-type integrase/transposase/recombinase [Gammaproteobacteria bacterium]MYH45389.1 DDE-type integrase/transposase/recombinase [Gammaproteobacteria bacterium]MYL14166.1 DDE-type integrase/transposase/recombinase [Gammaproteobacteria bacterium]
MNKLSTEKRAQILSMLVEGMSMRSITRITGVSINTVAKLLNDAGDACAAYHDAHVRGIKGNRRIECDEIWSFCYAKEKMVPRAKKAPKEAGDVWTWTAIDADSKLMLSYHVTNERDGQSALTVMDDLRQRLEGRPQITTDGLKAYVEAIEESFGADVDYAQVIKEYAKMSGGCEQERKYSPSVCTKIEKRKVQGEPDLSSANTTYVERHNLTMRMGVRRFTRLTNAFSKRIEKHAAMVSLFALHYNFCRIHKTLKVTPAMDAGIETKLRDCEWIVGLIDEMAPEPAKPGPKSGTRYKKSN